MDTMDTILSYFGTGDGTTPRWQPVTDKRWDDELVAAVLALAPRNVVDAGCGQNRFKDRLPRLVGIDIGNPAADIVCDMVDAPITNGRIDVVLAIGSVNFGDRDTIAAQLTCIHRWLRPCGSLFMRVNPGIPYPDCPSLVIYPWSVADVYQFAETIGFRVASPPRTVTLGDHTTRRPRLYWRYEKS